MVRRKPRYEREREAGQREVKAEVELPKGAIRADISQQAPHNSYGGAPLYYVDETIRCVDCGREETWTATQQQWWYEVAKGHIFSKAIHCRECRAALRAAHGGNPRRSHRDRNENRDAH